MINKLKSFLGVNTAEWSEPQEFPSHILRIIRNPRIYCPSPMIIGAKIKKPTRGALYNKILRIRNKNEQ